VRSLVAPGSTLVVADIVDPGRWTSQDFHVNRALAEARMIYDRTSGAVDAADLLRLLLHPQWLEMAAAGEVTGVMPPLRPVNAARSKRLRAEPVQALYEQSRAHHVGIFAVLESQQTTWIPGDSDSPDRLDSLVHGITWLYDHARHVTSIRRPPQQVNLPSGVGGAMGGQMLGNRYR